MFQYIVKRLLLLLVTLWGITLITFIITRLAPGDPATLQMAPGAPQAGSEGLRKEIIEENRKIYGLDKALLINFHPEDREAHVRKLLKDLIEGNDEKRKEALTKLIEVDTIALPHLADALESATSKTLQLKFLDAFRSVLPLQLKNDYLADSSETDSTMSTTGTLAWWKAKKSFFAGISQENIDDTLRGNEWKSVTQYGTFAIPFLIPYIKTNDPELRYRGTTLISGIGRKQWILTPDAEANRVREVYTFSDHWWKNHKSYYLNYTPTQQFFRMFTDTQYGIWMEKVIRFDFDISYKHKRPVIDLIKERLPISLQLSVISIFLSFIIAIPLGIYSSTHQYSISDKLITVVLFVLYSMPSFWVAQMLILFTTGGEFPRLFPATGLHSVGADEFGFWKYMIDWLWHLILPITVFTYGGIAFISRQMRVGMLEIIRSDFIRTARAKGLSERVVIFKHALRNALIPILTLAAALLPAMLGGSVIIEEIFTIDGMGRLSFQAILNRDYPIINGIAFFSAALTLLGVLLSDLSYALVDPRIKYE